MGLLQELVPVNSVAVWAYSKENPQILCLLSSPPALPTGFWERA